MDREQQIDHLLSYVINPVHKIREHIDYMYHWMIRLAMSGVYEFYIEQQMLIILNSLSAEWYPVRQSLENRLKSLDFNNLADEMLFERERLYAEKGIRRTGRSASHLDVAAKFIPWFEQAELGEDDFDEIDDVIGDPTYVPTI